MITIDEVGAVRRPKSSGSTSTTSNAKSSVRGRVVVDSDSEGVVPEVGAHLYLHNWFY